MYKYIIDKASDHFRSLRWKVPDDFGTYSHFQRIVRNKLDWNSSPGYPYIHTFGANNRQMFKVDEDGNPDVERMRTIWQLLQYRMTQIAEGEKDCDPIRLFVKPEPHKIKKIELKRYRLISSVSVLDQILDHMIADDMNDLAPESHRDHSMKVGWTPSLGGWRSVPMSGFVSSDKTAWDWTCRPWLLQMFFDLRVSLCDNKDTPVFKRWMRLAMHRQRCLFVKPIFITSGGLIIQCKFDGVMKSGCVDTLVENSVSQYLLELRVFLELGWELTPLWSMGDDVTRKKPPDLTKYKDKLSEFCIVKNVSEGPVEFAGHMFYGRVVEPSYKGKHAFSILHINDKVLQSMADSYSILYHRSKYRDYVRGLFSRIGASVPPLSFCDQVFDGDSRYWF